MIPAPAEARSNTRNIVWPPAQPGTVADVRNENMNYLINYAAGSHQNAQKRNTASGGAAGFDQVIELGPHHLDPDFKKHNSEILALPRGAGYWLWKPYIIWVTLHRVPENSFVFYCDSGAHFIGPVAPAIETLKQYDQPVLCFEHSGEVYEEMWTKGDACYLTGYQFGMKKHLVASYLLFKNNIAAKRFVSEWLTYAQDPRIITDVPSNVPNHPMFKDSRHDQALFSILCHKRDYLTFRDPSQWGPEELTPPDVVKRSTYPQFIVNKRDRD